MRLLSRNAESLFWLARYLERAASLARVIEMQSSFGSHNQEDGWNWLLTLHTDEERFKEQFELSTANIVNFYVTEKSNPNSIRSSVFWARENARSLRPFIPLEMWTQLNAFHGTIESLASDDVLPTQLPRTCAAVRAGCLAQIGIAEGTLFRDEGFQFYRLGLLVERADQTSRLLDVKYAQGSQTKNTGDYSNDFTFWSTILRTAAAYQVFHRLEPASADPERVARFLVLNPSHPRSINFCVREISEALHVLRSTFQLSAANSSLEACDVLKEGLQAAARDEHLLERLHGFNDWIQRAFIELTEEISVAFFRTPRPDKKEPLPAVAEDTAPTGNSQNQRQSQS